MNVCTKLIKQDFLAINTSEIEKDGSLEDVLWIAVHDPFAKIFLPAIQLPVPFWIACHNVGLTFPVAYSIQFHIHLICQNLEVDLSFLPEAFLQIHSNNSIALIGGQCLLSPALASHGHKGKFTWCGSQLFHSQIDQASVYGISNRADDFKSTQGVKESSESLLSGKE